MATELSRRTLVCAMGVTAAGSLLPGSVAANVGVPEAAAAGRSFNRLQSASPEATPSLLDGLGLREIEVVVTSEGVAMPSSSVAGPTREQTTVRQHPALRCRGFCGQGNCLLLR